MLIIRVPMKDSLHAILYGVNMGNLVHLQQIGVGVSAKATKVKTQEPAFHGDRLKRLREQMGMTQPEFEKLLGMGIGTISRYERGEIEPGSVQLSIFAKKLQVSVDWLLGLSENPEPDTRRTSKRQPSIAEPRNAMEAKFLEKYRRGELMELIRDLADESLITSSPSDRAPKDKAE